MVKRGKLPHKFTFIFLFVIIYIVVPLYRRKFSHGHIILVSYVSRKNIFFNVNFRYPILIELVVLRCPDRDLTSLRKRLSEIQEIVASVTQNIMQRISRNFVLSCIPTAICVCLLLGEIANQTVLLFLQN